MRTDEEDPEHAPIVRVATTRAKTEARVMLPMTIVADRRFRKSG
jgi:hypothetical protein